MQILEIAAVTGSSIIALAAQEPDVVDPAIDDRALKVARQRFKFYGLTDVQPVHGNALDDELASRRHFDLILLFIPVEARATYCAS